MEKKQLKGITFYLLSCYLFILISVIILLRSIETSQNSVGPFLIVALIVTAVFYFLYNKLIRPVKRINQVVREMATGEQDSYIQLHSSDELGELAQNLNTMARHIRETLVQVKSEKNLEQVILNSMTDGVIAVNEKGEVLFTNYMIEEILGIDQSNSYGKNILGVIHNYDVERIFAKALQSNKSLTKEVQLLTPEPKYFRVKATPLVIEEIDQRGVLVLLHDVTERKRMEDMRSDFVTNVSHELRTPLTSIKGFLETLLNGAVEDPPTAIHFLNIMNKETERLTSMVNELLNLSKIEGRRVIHRWQKVQLIDTIHRVVTMFTPQAHDKNIELITELPSTLPSVYGDPDMLTQVLINIVDNAIKYTPSGGKVFIRAKDEKKKIKIVIEDTGIGIPPESLSRVFERFYRVDKARSRELGGIGVGLAIVKHIIRAHGGMVFAESSVGGGSIFSFTLPVKQEDGIGDA